jgi:hypothetical protein
MESLFVNLIPSLIEKISTETENSKEHKNALVSLKKVFLIECRINLKLLVIAKNNKIQKPEIYKLLCNLSNDSSKALYSYVNSNFFDDFFKRIKLKKKRTDNINDDPILVSIISKIELLKLLSIDFNNLESNKIIRINARVNNLYKQLKIIVEELNKDLNVKSL